MNTSRLPVTLLTGFLGSGKTTLLNRWLRQPEMADTLVIINEFGAVGLDHLLVAHQLETATVVTLENGCLCCQLRTNLKQTLKDIHWRFSRNGKRQFRRVVIETSGLADPVPIVHTLMTDAYIAASYQLDGIVTLVDAVLGEATLHQHPEAVRQVKMADMLLMSKMDIADSSVAVSLQEHLRVLNPYASMVVLNQSIAPDILFGLEKPGAFPHWLSVLAEPGLHGAGRSTDDLSLVLETPLPRLDFERWLQQLRDLPVPGLLRFKGIFHLEGEANPVAVHRVQHVLHPPQTLAQWPDDNQSSRLVFITQEIGMDLQQLLQPLARFASAHRES